MRGSIEAIIFDRFGVVEYDYLAQAYRYFGGDPVAEAEFIRRVVQQAHAGLILGVRQAFARRFNIAPEAWTRACRQEPRFDERLLGLIARLRQGGYRTAMLTNSSADPAELEAVTPLFDVVVMSSEVGLAKPDAEIYRLAARRLGVAAEACVMVDDSPRFCQGAQAAGMEAVAYTGARELSVALERLVALAPMHPATGRLYG
jgi:putative hydrolase of the HAD superfamily